MAARRARVTVPALTGFAVVLAMGVAALTAPAPSASASQHAGAIPAVVPSPSPTPVPTPGPPLPVAPASVTATAADPFDINVSWPDPNGGTVTYELTNGNQHRYLGHSTSYPWTGLAPGTYMCFAVRGLNSSGYGPWSPYGCTTTPGTPPRPTGVSMHVYSPWSYLVQWTDNSGGKAQYEVSTTDNGPPAVAEYTSAGATSLLITGRTPGGTECARVRSYNQAGASSWVDAVCIDLPYPYATPDNVAAVAADPNTIRILWLPHGTDHTYFEVSNGTVSRYTALDANAFTWSGLAPNTTMCFHVRAYNTLGTSNWTIFSCATTPPAPGQPPLPNPPTAPLVLRSQANGDYVSAELGYAGASTAMLRARSTTLGSAESWREVSLANGDIALQSVANGDYVSAELGYTGSDYAELRARASTIGPWETFKLIWNSDGTYSLQSVANGDYVSAELGYTGANAGELRARSTSIGPWEKFTTSTGGSGCTDYGPTGAGPNGCRGFSTASTWFSGGGVGLHGQEIWTYANGTVKDSSASYTLTGLDTTNVWQLQAYIPSNHSNASHAHYHFCPTGHPCQDGYVNQNNFGNQWATFGTVCTVDGTVSVVLADDGGDKYPVQVGADAIQAVRTSASCASTAPAVPTGVTATPAGSDRIHVTWNDPSGGTAQFVISNGNVSQPNLGAGTTSYTWTGLSPGTYMCFTAKSVNPLTGASSDWSAYGCTTIPIVADVPSGLTATVVSGSTIHVAWNAVADPAAGYVLSNGNVSSNDLPAGTTSYDWTGLSPGTYMCFTIKSVNITGGSDWSPYACATIPQVPAPPGGVTATTVPGSTSAIDVSWNAVSGTVDQYVVTDGTTTQVTDGHTTSLAWTGLAPGTKLCVTVAAENVSGGSAPSPPACATTPTAPYVIVGDSYSAGEGTGNYDPGTDSSTNACHRSPDAFGRQYAAGPPVLYPPADLVDVACSGATIDNLTTAGQYGEPAQISQIPPTASLVTVTIGGNDAGFADVLTRCATPSTGSCEDYYTQDDANNEDALIESLQPSLTDAYLQIRKQAPNARVIAVTYPDIFGPGTEGATQSTCLNIGFISASDVEWLIDELYHLDDVIDQAALAAGIEVLDERYAMVGHELCSSAPWVNGLLTPPVTEISKAFHPNAAGYAQIAADLGAAVSATSSASATRASLVTRAAAAPGGATWAGWRNAVMTARMPSTARALVMFGELQTMAPSNTSYDASYFGDWSTKRPSVPGCNRRDLVLARDADPGTTTPVPTKPCRIANGTWQSPYNDPAGPLGTITGDPTATGSPGSPVDVDHVVSKKDAWVSGADDWIGTPMNLNQERIDFANDSDGLELLTVSARVNSQKSDLTPDLWLPDNSDPPGNPAFTCDFLKMYVAVKWQYDLSITLAEWTTINARLTTAACGP